jgi:hypothetical protein
MPTNLLRKRPTPARPPKNPAEGRPRRVLIRAGRIAIRAELRVSPTADRI